jgi:prepilin peptidase CpaA
MFTQNLLSSNSIAVLLVILCMAVLFDQRTRKIPNPLVLAGLVVAFFLNALINGFDGFKQSLFGTLVGLLVLAPFFVMRVLGAGDVKLMAVVGAFLGPAGALLAILFTMIAGGFLAVIVLFTQGRLQSTLKRMKSLEQISQPSQSSTRLPYSWAILIGTLGSIYSKV